MNKKFLSLFFIACMGVTACSQFYRVPDHKADEGFTVDLQPTMSLSIGETQNLVLGINYVGEVTSNPEILSMITISDPNFAINKLSFSLRKTNNAGTSTTLTQSSSPEDAPLYLIVNGNSAGKWLWPKEGSNIALAYKNFSTWANNAQTALDWYDSKYASSTRIISW